VRRKRSHTVYDRLGRKISISLEDAFWSCLKKIAHAQGTTPSAMAAEIDKTANTATCPPQSAP
jgi:predicted DNA-binding ribbon-helix-helix protein